MLLQQKSPWIRRNLSELQNRLQQAEPLQNTDSTITYLGKHLVKNIATHSKRRVYFSLTSDSLNITMPVNYANLPQKLTEWYKKQAREYITTRVNHFSPIMHVAPKDIWIKTYKRKWGLCRSDGIISFNWRLMHFPPEIIDYVVVHELAHLIEPNHSANFYRLVQEVLPDYKGAKDYLDKIGVLLV